MARNGELADVLSPRYAVKNIARLALEINGPHFAGGCAAASSALSGSSARSPAGLLCSLARAPERDAQTGERWLGVQRGHGVLTPTYNWLIQLFGEANVIVF